VYLLGFCLQDTSFQSWQTNNRSAIASINHLLAAIAHDSGVRSHVQCSNPDIEVAVRANDNEGFVFVFAHEPAEATGTAAVRGLPFAIGKVVDLETGAQVPIRSDGDATVLDVDAPTGATKLLHLIKK
jgi:hypothetical protein